MSRTSFDVQDSYTGDGATSVYTFDFKINSKSQLLVVERNASLVETQRVRGTDVTYLSSVVFDAEDGGGTVTLAANLTSGYKLDFFLADDEPVQEDSYRGKSSFTLRNFENSLDKLVGAIQRVAFLAQRSVKLLDTIDSSTFDITLPSDIVGSASKVLATNSAGTAFEMGPSVATIAAAIQAGIDAAAAQTAAEAAQTAAEAAQTGAEAAQAAAESAASTAAASAPPAVTTNITDGLGATTITDGVTPYTFTPGTGTGQTEWVHVEFSIFRGTTVVGSGVVELVYDGSAWNVFEGDYDYPTGKSADHGLTFSMSSNSLQVAADSGAGSGRLYTKAFQS